LDPIIKPTLKNANFGPKILVKPNDKIVNKISITERNKKLFLINFDLHKKSYNSQEKIIDNTENKIAVIGEISSTFLSTINTPAL
jgi:hypothetical protein